MLLIASDCFPLYLTGYVLSEMWRSGLEEGCQVLVHVARWLVATLFAVPFHALSKPDEKQRHEFESPSI